jgi:uncharacterized protein HemY
LILLFGVISFLRIGLYKDPVTFWTKAVEDSPKAGFPKLILGSWTTDTVKQEKILEEAYLLDSNLRNLGLYLGRIKYKKKQYDLAERYFTRELKFSQTTEIYMDLAYISFIKNDLGTAAMNLEKILAIDPRNKEANNNLALLYLQTNQTDKALRTIENMKQQGLTLSPALVELDARIKKQ